MSLQHKLSALFNIHPGEGRLVGLMLANAIFMGIPSLVTETTAYTLFLIEFDARLIPYVYIGFAVVTSLIGFIYTRLERRLSFSKLLFINMGLLLLSLGLLRVLLWLTEARWPVVALAIWSDTMWALTSLAYWSLASHLFNVRQGKRLFGLLGAGLILAEVISGFSIPILVGLIGTANLLFVAMAGLAGSLVVQIYIKTSFAGKFVASDGEKDAEEESERSGSFVDLIKNHYIVLIFATAALHFLTYYFLDNIFYAQAETRYSEADRLAGFIGVFFAVTGLLTAVFGAFISGRFIGRYGVRAGLLTLPAVLAIGTLLVGIAGAFFEAITILFWFVIITKLFNELLKDSIHKSTSLILYQPLSASRRVQAQTAVESIVEPIAGGMAGVILLTLTTLFAFEVVQLAYVLLFILAVWITVAVLLGHREYPAILRQALTTRRLSGTDLSLADRCSVTVLQDALQSPHPGVVIYALNMLAEIEHDLLPSFLPDLLAHPTPEVRQEALHHIERLGLTSALGVIRQRIPLERSVPVRGAIWRTLAALDETEALEELYPHLQDPEPQIRLGAMVGLLRCGEIEGIVAASEQLITQVSAADPVERAFAAQVLGQAGIHSFYRPLLKLLQDDDLQVRRAALVAAGQVKNPKLWPAVIRNLAVPKVRTAAMAALVAGGEGILSALKSAFVQEDQVPEVQIRLARICGRIGGEGVVALLKGRLTFPDDEVRTHILAALSRCGYQAGDNERAMIQKQVQAEIATAASTLATLVDIDPVQQASSQSPTFPEPSAGLNSTPGNDQASDAIALLTGVLNDQLARHRERIFLLLSFIYDSGSVSRVRDTLSRAHTSPEKRAYALETLDVLVPQGLKVILFPLLEALTPQQRLEQLRTTFPQPGLDYSQRLQELISGAAEGISPWLQACALYTVGALRLSTTELVEAVISVLRSDAAEPLVRETAAWTLVRLDGGGLDTGLSELGHDPDPQVAGAVKQLETARNGGRIPLSTIEKVIILKTVSLFASTPDEILVEVAALLEEVDLKAGEMIFEKGAQGDCMYMIVSGQVRVHDGDHTLNHLVAGDLFGEMAVLDPEPRLASVTVVEDTCLLRLDQEPFYELMEDQIGVARGIIHVLSGYLRYRVRDLNQLRARLQELSEK